MSKNVIASNGDIATVDDKGDLWKDEVCLCHKDSIIGKYYIKEEFLK